jgi:hypothetical protein
MCRGNQKAILPFIRAGAVTGGLAMQGQLARAQHYRSLALHMHKTAKLETDGTRRSELTGLAEQYERLAEKLLQEHSDEQIDLK